MFRTSRPAHRSRCSLGMGLGGAAGLGGKGRVETNPVALRKLKKSIVRGRPCLVILLKCCFLALLSCCLSLVLGLVRLICFFLFFSSGDSTATVTALQSGRSPYYVALLPLPYLSCLLLPLLVRSSNLGGARMEKASALTPSSVAGFCFAAEFFFFYVLSHG